MHLPPAATTDTPPSCPLQAFSIALSFVLFPKPFTPAYLVGGAVFAVGLVLNVYRKNQRDIDAACARGGRGQAPPDREMVEV